ncbi:MULTISPECIES: hypothetical protein [unclassified Bacillus (in: firmicutes)]|uniref:hypothetical protein n=1 Tax=unclassified Bacillus (in: firmicutes) TaxID=185979 RepID=UPI000BF15BE4|nr:MULTISPECIES: hypothetical protein [unclassified Bacillus (in: firmicutes)]PEJ53112.1 hypothetical protein CN692_21605 [Bacillus sp. AFS002410]PEL13717.1 hypothetical protein CN601_03115 [Bacillus sp. AFS017336]
MKIKTFFTYVLLPLIIFVAIYLRIQHKISTSTFGLIGLVFATIEFIRMQFFDTMKTKEKPITDLKDLLNPIKNRKYYVGGLVMVLGVFYFIILIFSVLGQISHF